VFALPVLGLTTLAVVRLVAIAKRVLRMPIYVAAGVTLAILASASLLISDEPRRVFMLALVAATVLWASAARVLAAYTFQTDPVPR
jgi:hypothetical protein